MSIGIVVLTAACGKKDAQAPQNGNTDTPQVRETAVAVAVPKESMTAAAETEAPPETQAPVPAVDLPETPYPVHLIIDTVRESTEGVGVQYNKISLEPADEKRYPGLAAALKDYSDRQEEGGTETFTQVSEVYTEDQKSRPEFFAGGGVSYNDETSVAVLRADAQVVSIYHDYWSYTGGAHGMYGYWGINYDTATGKRLLLTDVITDREQFFRVLKEHIDAYYTYLDEEITVYDEYVRDLDLKDPDALAWSIDNEGVTVYFNPYELGSYALGAIVASVYFDENPELFVEKYANVPDSYVIPELPNRPLLIDADGNGKREELTIEYKGNGEYEAMEWVIHHGNRSVTLSDWCYSEKSYIIKANGQYYLYTFEVSDNDYSLLAVTDLRHMTYESEKTENGALSRISSDWKETENSSVNHAVKAAFADPGRFSMEHHIDILGTYGGEKTWSVGGDGYPETADSFYRVHSGRVLRTRQPVKCCTVDENGKKLADETIGADEYIFMIRTDGESWADFQIVDKAAVETFGEDDYRSYYSESVKEDPGKPVYRIEIRRSDNESWTREINGTDEGEVLDGIVYAG